MVDVSPTTRQSVEAESRTPLQGKARGMWALLAAESRPAAASRPAAESKPADSTSEDAEESEGTIGREESDVPARDIRRVQIGRDIGSLNVERVLEGTTVNVCEYSSTTCYGKEGKVFQENKERRYRVAMQRRTPTESGNNIKANTKVHRVSKEQVGASLTDKELETTCVGKVKNINQTVKRETFRDGELVHQEEIVTDYEVNLEAGFLSRECY